MYFLEEIYEKILKTRKRKAPHTPHITHKRITPATLKEKNRMKQRAADRSAVGAALVFLRRFSPSLARSLSLPLSLYSPASSQLSMSLKTTATHPLCQQRAQIIMRVS